MTSVILMITLKTIKTRDFELQKNKSPEYGACICETGKWETYVKCLTCVKKTQAEFIAADVALVENGNSSEKMYSK